MGFDDSKPMKDLLKFAWTSSAYYNIDGIGNECYGSDGAYEWTLGDIIGVEDRGCGGG